MKARNNLKGCNFSILSEIGFRVVEMKDRSNKLMKERVTEIESVMTYIGRIHDVSMTYLRVNYG